MNIDELAKLSVNKGNNTDYANFDLTECIRNFSLLDFIKEGRENPSKDYGGFLICTPRQYIFGYNAGFGYGAHSSSFARALKDIEGGGKITSFQELNRLSSRCEHSYLCARLAYESYGNDEYGRPTFSGFMHFLTKTRISEKMFKSFEKFIEDYRNEIELAIKNSNGTFYLSYYSIETGKSIHTNSIDEVIEYVRSHIDYDYDPDSEEQIIGISNGQQRGF